tara:strand:+ start:52 stop:360 length:309 start_codon:yes stop_codon:yes gene_type:complete
MNINKMKKDELKYFILIDKARKVNFDINKITKNDPVKQEEKRKVISLIHKLIHDNQVIEAGFILYKKNRIIKYIMKLLANYYIKCFYETASRGGIGEFDLLF